MIRKILLLLIIFTSLNTFAQSEEDYYDGDYIRYEDYIYSENFKSVKLYKTGFDLSAPFIDLGSNQTLTLKFDDLNAESNTYYYSFILCNADWTPADLLSMEYMDGTNEEYFNVNTTSLNTTMRYTHYQVQLPSPNMKFTKSGNYLLKIYSDDDPDKALITRRMYVVENRVAVETEYMMAKSPHYRMTHQEMYVKVVTAGYPMPNIYEDFTLVIQQNGRTDNMIVKHQPKIMNDEFLYFNTANDILFDANNEFRILDIRSLKIQSANVNRIIYDSAGYTVKMLTDLPRTRYLKYEELNGNFSIIDWDDPQFSGHIEADYAFVDFSLKLDSTLIDGGVYLVGALTDWRIDNSSRMAYDRLSQQYTTSLLLKQGYYNYQYVYVPNGETKGNAGLFEGNYSETMNKYTMYVYYKDQGEYWDRLIGFSTINENY
ncbi:MAG: hypothetical protein B6I18_07050 [Bacteroidetes bacterium 4572_112]|nr:MAG: hypothetical protein B6I18_07050 [Bacteroidetes bacterium 4572_112]